MPTGFAPRNAINETIVLATLRATPGLEARQLSARTNSTLGEVICTLDYLIRDGTIERFDRSRYRLTETRVRVRTDVNMWPGYIGADGTVTDDVLTLDMEPLKRFPLTLIAAGRLGHSTEELLFSHGDLESR